jgi:4a-hydroxytetrahydrobiopterin dehydratase
MKPSLSPRRRKTAAPARAALSERRIALLLPKLRGWKLRDGQLCKTYAFKDYHHTMAFVNAVAWMAHRQNHHPDLTVSYNRCQVRYSTHAVNGLSENDFICAAKVDALME